ncbi:MAG: hypothetical protein MUF30_03510 [Burkholderiales bacterium]|jgi:beta-lactamase class A|nr:hypothetical protein [Burkholderiales bacterium]
MSRRIPRRAAIVGALLVIATATGACSSLAGPAGGRAPEGRTMAEVRNANGLPDAIRFGQDGRQIWEYTGRAVRGGAFRVTYADDGRVASVEPFRTRDDVARLRAGDTSAPEVVALLGDPDRIRYVEGAAQWEYPLPDRTRLLIRYGRDRRVEAVRIEGAAS